MPSHIAIATTALASIHERILPIPILILAGIFPFLQRLFPILLFPFSLAAKGVKYAGVIAQALFLLQGIFLGSLGDGLNSFASSSVPSASSSSASSSQMRQQLSELSSTFYPSSLSSLWGKHFEPMYPTTDPSDPIQLTQKDIDEYEAAGVTLKRDVEAGIQESVDLWLSVLDYPRIEYLHAVNEELDRIQAGRPTIYLYQDQLETFGEELERKIEAADNEYKAEQEAKMDQKFAAFLDQLKMDENARTTLDNPSDPKDLTSQTFRQLLRNSWEEMYGQGGVLGNLENEMSGLAGMELGMGRPIEPTEDINEKFSSPDYKPGRIPLMLNHLLRDQLKKAITSRNSSSRIGLAKYLEEEDPTDLQILPKLSRKVSDDYLGFFQRAVKIDIRARELVLRILSFISPSPSDFIATTSSSRSTSPSILLSIPEGFKGDLPLFGAFVKKLDWTLTRSSERFLSKHEFAKAAFGEETGYLALRRLEKELKELEHSIDSGVEKAQGRKLDGEL
ncbi:hypothetical protein JCM3765_003885 [Sporobolomyces pararoseus]